jgi:hypothetical protein
MSSRTTSILLSLALIAALAALAAGGLAGKKLLDERDELRRELNAETIRMLDLRERLTKAEIALQEKDAALATRDAALAVATRPELPVRVTFRSAWMGQGLVATIRNAADRPLNVIAEFRDPTANTTREFSLALDPKSSADIGRAEGWIISSGQSLTVAASGYRSITAFAP